jgi:hypothetical protein
MSVTENWSEIGPGSITGFGLVADRGSGGVPSGVEGAVATRTSANPPLYSPDNPLFWVGALLLVVGGAVGLSGWVDVGPVKGKASV